MRTTLTIDDDVARLLKEAASRRGASFKTTVNEILRIGLAWKARPARPRSYRLRPASLGGAAPGVDLDKALKLADALEDEAIARKMELRK